MFNLRIALGHIQEDLSPEAIDVAQNVCLIHAGYKAAALLCLLEGVPYDPLATLAADLAYLKSDLLAIALDIQAEFDIVERALDLEVDMALAATRTAAYADVKVLCVLANYQEVDVFGSFILQRSPDAFQELDRAQIHVLVQVETHGQENALFQNAGLDSGVANSPEIYGGVASELLQGFLPDQLSCL
ncbi:Uncharacterised protein [uncultured archaeon]|nr:Uncharacterised protein [uncultured archaeon]